MKKDANASLLPAVVPQLELLGRSIRAARQARAWTVAEAAARVVTSPATYKRIEAGDPSVAMGSWCNALQQLGLLGAVVAAAAPEADKLGQALREANAPKRVGRSSRKDADLYDF